MVRRSDLEDGFRVEFGCIHITMRACDVTERKSKKSDARAYRSRDCLHLSLVAERSTTKAVWFLVQ